jgi:hypothetical protein
MAHQVRSFAEHIVVYRSLAASPTRGRLVKTIERLAQLYMSNERRRTNKIQTYRMQDDAEAQHRHGRATCLICH